MWAPKTTFDTIAFNPVLTKTYSATAKTRFYDPTGRGRDDYIFRNNGGICPSRDPCKIFEKGEFVFQKQRHIDTIPTIHSKSLMYYSNGTGRDGYIYSSAGGLTKLNTPGECRNTFYNGLRHHKSSYTPKRCKSKRATLSEKADFYTKTQDYKGHQNYNVQKEYRNYQRTLDRRLSRPKKLGLKKIYQ